MSSLRAHFEQRAAALVDCANVESEDLAGGGVILRLRPHRPGSAVVVPYLLVLTPENDVAVGTVGLEDQGCPHVELGDDPISDRRAIDDAVDLAVEGLATGFHSKRGGCLEERHRDGTVTRSWSNAVGIPGWRRRWARVDYKTSSAPATVSRIRRPVSPGSGTRSPQT